MMHSIQLLAVSVRSRAAQSVADTLGELREGSLIMVTAHAPRIGCDNAAKMTKSMRARATMLKETAVPHGFFSRANFGRLVQQATMKRARRSAASE